MKIQQAKMRDVITTNCHGLTKGEILMASRFMNGNLQYDWCRVIEVIDTNQVAVRSLYFYERWYWRLKNLWKKINNRK